MKTKFLRVSKSTLSVVLSCMMLLSSVFVGSSETIASASNEISTISDSVDVSTDTAAEIETEDSDISDVVDSDVSEEDDSTVDFNIADSSSITNSKKTTKSVPNSSGDTSCVIKFCNTRRDLEPWQNLSVHLYDQNSTKLNGNWRENTSMMTAGSNNLYTYEFRIPSTTTTLNMIFSGEKTTDNKVKQTQEIKITNPHSFDFDNTVWMLDGSYNQSARVAVAKELNSWYIEGRFPSAVGSNWEEDSITYPLTKYSDTLYKYETGETLYSLSQTQSSQTRYLRFGRVTLSGGWQQMLPTSDTTLSIANVNTSSSNTRYNLSANTSKSFTFSDNDKTSGNVILWIDTTDSTPKFYFTLENSTNPDPDPTDFTVYFDKGDKDWSNVSMYIYDSNDNAVTSAWHGDSMTYNQSNKLWSATLTSNQVNNGSKIIFNDGTSINSSVTYGQQSSTFDFVKTDKMVYTCSGCTNQTVDDYTGLYIMGRFTKSHNAVLNFDANTGGRWNSSTANSDFVFEKDSDTGFYKFDTGSTLAELSKTYYDGTKNSPQYFYLWDTKSNTTYKYSSSLSLIQANADTHFKLNGSSNIYFGDTLDVGNVVLYFDPTTSEFWYELTGTSTQTLNVASGKSNYFDFNSKDVFVGTRAYITIRNIPDGKVVNQVTVRKVPQTASSSGTSNSSSVTKSLKKTTASGDTDTIEVTPEGTNVYSFLVPDDENITLEVSVTFRNPNTYTVTAFSSDENLGTVAVSKSTVTEGKSVTLIASPAISTNDKDNYLENWEITEGSGTIEDASSSTTKITPTSNVKVKGTFAQANVTTSGNNYLLYNNKEVDNIGNWATEAGTTILPIKKNESTGKYFVDIASNDIKSYEKNKIYFAVVNTNDYHGWITEIVNATANKTVTNNYTSYISTATKENGSAKYGVCTITDSVSRIRIYIDNPVAVTNYEVIPTYEYVASVKIYAKFGTTRSDSFSQPKYAKMATTTLTKENGDNLANKYIYKDKYYEYDTAEPGDKIKIITTIDSAYINQYYVKAFCINGKSYGIIDQPATDDTRRTTSGEYTLDYTIPDDTDYIEITPIYFYLTDGEYADLGFITFHVENFAGDIVKEWGNTLACQAWYSSGSETSADLKTISALGGYPGQPLVLEDGDYYMQVPKRLPGDDDGSITVQGITMNNYYWDTEVHKVLSAKDSSFKGENNTRNDREINSQTYDYNDFAALAAMGADDIIFNMKYRTATSNKDQTSTELLNSSKYGNDWNGFVDYFDRGIDLFGNILYKDNGSPALTGTTTYNESDIESYSETGKLWIVSKGYQAIKRNTSPKYASSGEDDSDGYYGNYATVWDIYSYDGATFTLQGSLPGSSLIPNAQDCSYEYLANGLLPTSTDSTLSASDTTKTMYAANKENFLSFCTTKGTAQDAYFDTYVKLYNSYKGTPAVITFEKAITEAGVQDDPGLRSDGRWYYSATSNSANPAININPDVTAKIKIQYKGLNDEDYTDDVLDASNEYRGTTTTASVYFTTPDNSSDNVNKTTDYISATMKSSISDYFRFEAEQTKIVPYTVTDENGNPVIKYHVYVFRGWYLDTGETETLLNEEDPYAIAGKSLRRVSNTFIAKYEEVDSDVVLVSHEVLKKNSTDTTAKSGGNGKTYTTVEVQTTNGAHVTTYSKTEGNVVINPTYLSGNYQFKITLEYEPDNSSKYVKTYSDSNGSNALESTTFTLSYTDLIEAADTDTKIVVYYTDFSVNTLTVTFKYYDRKEKGGKDDVNQLRNVNVEVTYKSTDTLQSVLIDTINGKATTIDDQSTLAMTNITNLMDKYYFWVSQLDAETDFAKLTNLHTGTTTDGVTAYLTYGNTTGAELAYHTDNYGNPVIKTTEDETDTYRVNGETINISEWEKWVTYTFAENVTEVEDPTDPSAVTAVTLWAYNLPKTYVMNFRYPEEPKSEDNLVTLTLNSDFGVYTLSYGANDEYTKVVDNVYYNQRVGAASDPEELRKLYDPDGTETEKIKADNQGKSEDEIAKAIQDYFMKEYGDSIDKAGYHISQYGVTKGYAGDKIEAVSKAKYTYTDDGNEVQTGNLVFDGWYDANTHVKVSSDRIYGNRVTSNQTLIAGYVPESSKSDEIGVSVTKLDDDYFIVNLKEGSTELTERRRFNTELNVYNSEDNNSNIKRTAVIYVQLPITSEHTTQYWKDQFVYTDLGDKIQENITTNLNNGFTTGQVSYKNQSITWNVVENVTETASVNEVAIGYNNSSNGDYAFELNNKNRGHYTLNLTNSLWEENAANSAMLAYAAIYYDNDGTAAWIVSDNAAEHINATVSETNPYQ